MKETAEEIAALQALMDASHAGSTSHLREIVSGDRRLSADRPAVSAAHVDGERLGVFCHGRAVQLAPDDPSWEETIAHWTTHYGSDPTTWADDIRMYRVEPTWFVGYGTVSE